MSSVKNGSYDTYSGTSMATPHMTGLLARYMTLNASFVPTAGASITTFGTSTAVDGAKYDIPVHP